MNLFYRKFIVGSGVLIFALCISFLGLSDVSAKEPKLANYYLNELRTDATFIDEMSRYDMLILTPAQISARSHVVQKIHANNPDVVVLAYVPTQSYNTQYWPNNTIYKHLKVNDSWWLRDGQGNKISPWPGLVNTNLSTGWNNELVSFVESRILDLPYVDGIFFDIVSQNLSWLNGGDIDIDNDGQRDISTKIDAIWKSRTIDLLSRADAAFGDAYIVINGASTPEYQPYVNGRMFETFPTPWEGNGTWQTNMNAAKQILRINNTTEDLLIFNANTNNTGNQSDYKNMRFGFASSLLLDDVYYSYDYGDQNHGQTWWYDEYNVDLGSAIGASASDTGATSYISDVWRRDFANGVAVVNSTNQTKRVSLAGEYEKIHGTQDSTVNDGSIVEEVTLSPEDGVVLLKTFEDIDDIIFTNGEFARFFNADGSRVRNGIFLFTEDQLGGVQIARIDLNYNGKPELILVRGNRVEIYRDDGQLYSRFNPYGGNYEGELRLAVGDLWGIRFRELFVAPSDGYPAPIKSYSYDGRRLRDDWYPFGTQYTGGYSLAVGTFNHPLRNHLAVGAGVGQFPSVHIFDFEYKKIDEWFAYEKSFRGGVFVATGDTNGDGIDEIVTGPGPGMKPQVRVFSYSGLLQSEFLAYSTFTKPGIRVQTADLDFDGKDDIVGLSSGVGL